MILRKPYAFLIKRFKLIHLILAFLLIYLAIKTYNIFDLFNSYTQSGYSMTGGVIAGSYVNVFMYVGILLVLGLTLTIYVLLKQKEKPTKFYVWLIIYYIILFVAITVAYGGLKTLESVELASKTIRAYRDVSLIISLPQYFFLIFSLIRGIGFDIRKFDFAKDLNDLEISASDSEEFEFELNFNDYKLKRKIRRFFRELKYKIIENKFLSACIAIIVITMIATTISIGTKEYTKTYKESEKFSTSYYKINTLGSILTPYDYNGNVITENKYYLAIIFDITNKTAIDQILTLTDFRLQIDGKNVYPTQNRNEYFIDLGIPYDKQILKSGVSNVYTIIYELPKANIQKNYKLKIQDQLEYQDGSLIAKYREITLTPTLIETIENVEVVNIGDTVSLRYSNLNSSSLTLKNYFSTPKYKFAYEYCTSIKCYNSIDVIDASFQTERSKTLMIFDYELKLDESSIYTVNIKNNTNTFFNNFIKVSYNLDGKAYTYKPINKSTSKLENKLILEVYDEIKEATDIRLELTVRDKRYIFLLDS